MQKSIWETGIRASYAILILLVAFWAAAWYGLFEADLPKGIRYAELTGGRSLDSKGRKLWHWEVKEIERVEIVDPRRIDLEFLQKIPDLKRLNISKETGLDVNLDISCRNGKGAFHLNEEETVELGSFEELTDLEVIGYDVSGWKLDCLFPNLFALTVSSLPNNGSMGIFQEAISRSVLGLFVISSHLSDNINVDIKQLSGFHVDQSSFDELKLSSYFVEGINIFRSTLNSMHIDINNIFNDCAVAVIYSVVSDLEIIPSGHSRIKVVIIDSYVPLEDIVKLREQGIEVSVSYREGYEEYFQTAESALKLLSKHLEWPSLEGESGVEVESATGEEPSAAFGGIQAATP